MNYDPKRDIYRLLGVSARATADEIKKAHRAKIREAHPDKHGGSTEVAAALNHARDVVLDPKKRAAYDADRSRFLAAKRRKARPQQATRSTAHKARAKTAAPPKPRKTAHKAKASSVEPQPTTPAVPQVDPALAAKFLGVVGREAVASWRRGEKGLAFVWGALGLLVLGASAQQPAA
ncbi:MAG: DnaJ domain-containing protein [Myxococcales bacterium]|nr:DnaJ domain-containing protein [Myxococcales bacterium]